ncbi:hypothetical protein [Mesorhizobium sp. Root552]|uniref:hypothetical protein n=1 Tax=Mesorhizobium sp. Root552 TaxID=1736555 RepID=UPI0039B73E58
MWPRPAACFATLLLLAAASVPTPALAHASDRGHVLLLPTGYYVVGGAFAVGASFLVLALFPPDMLERIWRKRLTLFPCPDKLRPLASMLSFISLAVLIAAGLFGSRDPLSNPLPLTIWTLVWIGLTLLHGLFGNLWSWINPWYGPYWLVRRFTGISPGRARISPKLGCWPAVILLFAFAWFELVDPAPDDPARLAFAVGFYWSATFIVMLIFGYGEWSRCGEFLSVFFAIVSRFAPVAQGADNRLRLCMPGARLLGAEKLHPSGTAFILLALSSVSFDGLSKTFFWLGLNGINPLEFPGRTALLGISTTGLLLSFAMLAAIFLLAVAAGQKMAGDSSALLANAGLLVWSIVPIALAYHIAHYLTSLLVDGQYAIAALSDPFGLGWNLFGTAHLQIGAGIVAGAESAWVLWNIQSGAIIAGHVLAVLVAHGLAFRLHPQPVKAAISQFPLTLLMIGYTIFGLWLLATPTAG